MRKEIITFIKENKIACFCCVDENNAPYCFNCFYLFDEQNHLLFFKSSPNTHHSKIMLKSSKIAGSILPDKMDFITLKGLQFTGSVLSQDFPDNINPEIYYHKKLPFAFAKPGKVWCIQLETLKMTDSTNLFGKKLRWEKSENYSE